MADTIKHTRQWFQFGARTMFVLVTVTATGLGWIAYERRQSRHVTQIAKDLETSGADIEFGGLFDPAGITNAAQHPKSSMWWHRALSGLVGPREYYGGMNYAPPPTQRWPQFTLQSLLLLVTLIALVIGGLPWLKRALDTRRYMEIRYLVRTGELTEDQVRESFGDEYPTYRKFVDSRPD